MSFGFFFVFSSVSRVSSVFFAFVLLSRFRVWSQSEFCLLVCLCLGSSSLSPWGLYFTLVSCLCCSVFSFRVFRFWSCVSLLLLSLGIGTCLSVWWVLFGIFVSGCEFRFLSLGSVFCLVALLSLRRVFASCPCLLSQVSPYRFWIQKGIKQEICRELRLLNQMRAALSRVVFGNV